MADVTVNSGDNLQTKINAANAGDRLLLEKGATWTCTAGAPFTVSKSLTLMTSGLGTDSALPRPGRQILDNTDFIGQLAKIQTSDGSTALYIDVDVDNVSLLGLQFHSTHASEATLTSAIVRVGDGAFGGPQDTFDKIPNNITIDQCVIYYPDTEVLILVKNGMELHCRNLTLTNSLIRGIVTSGTESHCVAAWNGAGPWFVADNIFIGSSINFFYGGAQSTPTNRPFDGLVFVRNHCAKPPRWNTHHASYIAPPYAGTRFIKNLFELKTAINALIEGNVFENSWAEGQVHAVTLSPNAGDTGTEAINHNVIFKNNIIRHCCAGFTGQGAQYGAASQSVARRCSHVEFVNNLMYDAGGNAAYYNGSESFFKISQYRGFTIRNNTMVGTYADATNGAVELAILFFTNLETAEGNPTRMAPFICINNVFGPGAVYGNIFGDEGSANVTNMLDDRCGSGLDNWTYQKNMTDVANDAGSNFPVNGMIDCTNISIMDEFVSPITSYASPRATLPTNYKDPATFGNWALKSATAGKNAGTDGQDIGLNMPALIRAITGRSSGGGFGVF